MRRINPPYDGSPPCPGCNVEVRGASALIHNFLNRWPDARYPDGSRGRAIEKLLDLKQSWQRPAEIAVPHPIITELMDVADALVAAIEGLEVLDGGMRFRWTPEVCDKIDAVIPRALAVSKDSSYLFDAHFYDRRHSSGDENILRASKGSTFYDGAYDYTVDIVEDGGDIQHSAACDTRLRLHEHFKKDLRKDPLFYGRVWCPKCQLNAPYVQFTVISDLA